MGPFEYECNCNSAIIIEMSSVVLPDVAWSGKLSCHFTGYAVDLGIGQCPGFRGRSQVKATRYDDLVVTRVCRYESVHVHAEK